MKNNNPLLLSLAAAMLTALPATATVPENFVTVNGKFSYQKSIFFDGDTVRADIGKVTGVIGEVRFNTKELMRYIADDQFITLPNGARFLHLSDGILAAATSEKSVKGSMWIVDRNGNFVLNASGYFDMEFDFDSLIWEGWYDQSGERTKNRFPIWVNFDFVIRDNRDLIPRGSISGLYVDMEGRGVMKENFQANTRNDVFRASNTGVGDGYVFGWINNNDFKDVKGDGDNAMGYFNLRIKGSQVIDED